MSEEIKNEIQQEPSVKYLICSPVTKSNFRSTNRVTEKRSANGVVGDVILLVPTDISTTGSTLYKIGICDITTAWNMQLANSKLVIFTSKSIADIEAKYNISEKTNFINLANTAKDTIEEESAKLYLEFLQTLVENDICIPKTNIKYGETEKRAPNNDVPTSSNSSDAATADMVPGRPAAV